jgi:nucleoid DNA-binding protein
MTHDALIKTLSIKLGLPVKTLKAISSAIFEEIVLALCDGEKVKIPRFGTIEIRKRSNSPNVGYIKLVQSRLVKRMFNLTVMKE